MPHHLLRHDERLKLDWPEGEPKEDLPLELELLERLLLD